MEFSLLLDVLLALLLAVTIGYAVVLNRRLANLRADRAELEKVALSFGQAATRAEDSLGKLKENAEMLQERLAKSQALADDLSFLVDRGGTVADRLEELVRAGRDEVGVGPPKPAAPPPPQQQNPFGAPMAAEPEPRGVEPRGVEPLGVEPRGLPEDTPDGEDFEPRSDAERELLKALQSAR